jgi:protein-S-isoprenylcysteine O-methyltransferase Ste14
MWRFLAFFYGVTAHAMFLVVFLYLIGFVSGVGVPKSIDSPPRGPVGLALFVNLLLIAAFGIQHSVMARPSFKRWWTRFVPAPIERSTFVIATNLVLILLFWQWRPLGGEIWTIESPVVATLLHILAAAGWIGIVLTTCLINHFDLFGTRQVWLYMRGKPYTYAPFVTPGPYRYVRHPLYACMLAAFWSTPTMTVTHLVFALGMTAYILIGIRFEERNLVEFHGDVYEAYRRDVPMLVPGTGRQHRSTGSKEQGRGPAAT